MDREARAPIGPRWNHDGGHQDEVRGCARALPPPQVELERRGHHSGVFADCSLAAAGRHARAPGCWKELPEILAKKKGFWAHQAPAVKGHELLGSFFYPASWPAAADRAPRAGGPLWQTRGWTSPACRRTAPWASTTSTPSSSATLGGWRSLSSCGSEPYGRTGWSTATSSSSAPRAARASSSTSAAQRPLQLDQQTGDRRLQGAQMARFAVKASWQRHRATQRYQEIANRTRDPPVPGAGARTTRQLPRTSSKNKSRKQPRVFAPRPRRSQKTWVFAPRPGRAGMLEIAEKTMGFSTSATPIPAEGRASMLEIAKTHGFLHLDHADPHRGSRGNFRNRKKPSVFAPRPRRSPQRVARAPQKSQKTTGFCGFCTSTTPIPAEGRFSCSVVGTTPPP